MFISIILITFAVILFHWMWTRKYDQWKKLGLPYLPGSFPFGTKRELSLFTKYTGYLFKELYDKLAPHPFGGIFMWNSPFLLLRDPEIIRTVMTKEFQHFRDRATIETSTSEPLSQHLFGLSGDLWRAVRVKLTPTFTSGRLKNMFSLFEASAAQLDNELKKITVEGEAVDIKDVTTCFTLDIITSCAFGLETNSAENEEFRKNSQRIFSKYVRFDLKVKIALSLIFPFIRKITSLNFLEKEVEEFIMTFVKNAVKYREENNVRRNDFLDLMIQLKNKGTLEGESKEKGTKETISLEMTPELLAAQCFVFFAAGFETSSSVQSYALYELALHQDVQDRLRKEIDDVTKENGDKVTYQALQEMPYLDQIISEVVRKYPTLPLLTRRCVKSLQLSDRPKVTIEEGTEIFIPVYALHHDPKFFPNPEKFDPERFSPANKPKIVPYSYLPFGEGPRHCIGMRFGLLQTKMGLYTVLSKYKVMPSEETPAKLDFVASDGVSTVGGPIKLKIQPREDLTNGVN